MSKYFEVKDDLESPFAAARWHLGDPFDTDGRELDAREFRYGRAVGLTGPLSIKVAVPGKPLDFTFTTLDMPVVRRGVAEIIASFAPGDIERIPAVVIGYPGDYEILNFTRTIQCVDEAQSMIERWTAAGNRPDRPPGTYRLVYNLRLLPERVSNYHCFRVTEWDIALVFSEPVVQALRRERVTGIRFESLT